MTIKNQWIGEVPKYQPAFSCIFFSYSMDSYGFYGFSHLAETQLHFQLALIPGTSCPRHWLHTCAPLSAAALRTFETSDGQVTAHAHVQLGGSAREVMHKRCARWKVPQPRWCFRLLVIDHGSCFCLFVCCCLFLFW